MTDSEPNDNPQRRPKMSTLLPPLLAHDPEIFARTYPNNWSRPGQWWIRPDGTLWPMRWFDEHVEEIKRSIGACELDIAAGHHVESARAKLRTLPGELRYAERQRKSRRRQTGACLLVARKCGDDVSAAAYAAERKRRVRVPEGTTRKLLTAIEERYGFTLIRLRKALGTAKPTPRPKPDPKLIADIEELVIPMFDDMSNPELIEDLLSVRMALLGDASVTLADAQAIARRRRRSTDLWGRIDAALAALS